MQNSLDGFSTIDTCFKKMGRSQSHLATKCIQDAIIYYVENYTTIELLSTGVSIPIIQPLIPKPPISVDDEYSLKHYGKITVAKPTVDSSPITIPNGNYNDGSDINLNIGHIELSIPKPSIKDIFGKLFTTFSISRIMGVNTYIPNKKGDLTAVTEGLFNDILYWLNCNMWNPLLPLTSDIRDANILWVISSGFKNDTWIKSEGTLTFNITNIDRLRITKDLTTHMDNMIIDNSGDITEDNFFDIVLRCLEIIVLYIVIHCS
jgi:hypothetical protein